MQDKSTLKLNLTLTFADANEITPKEVEVIINNVLSALQSQVDGPGLAPQDAVYYTDLVDIRTPEGNGLTYDFSTNQTV